MTTRNRRSTSHRRRSNPREPAGLFSLAGGALGAAAGAFAMYLFDPRSGRRRRALLRDKMRRSWHEVETLTERAVRDARHRAKGIAAEGRALVRDRHLDDEVLHERVRARLGRACSHPRAIEVVCKDGEVELHGPVLESEHRALLASVRAVRGVKRVRDCLEVHATADSPSLQGTRGKTGPQREVMRQSWTPAARLVGLLLGVGLMGYGAFQRRAAARVLGLLGAGLASRAYANRPTTALIGAKATPIEIQKTLHIEAPVDEVYRFFEHPENLPRFMTHVEAVQRKGDGGYHWEVEGPAGRRFTWDATFDAFPNESVRWRSVEGSTIENEGVVRFEEENGGTRVHVHMFYRPPAGVLGHAFARVFGADPKHAIDDDLLRLKSLLEDGAVTGRFGKIRRDVLEHEANMTSPLFGRIGARPPVEKQ